METIEYRTFDKSGWGDGPWQTEPDKKQWQDPATGYPCLIVRAGLTGALCGYVGVPKGHACHGHGYDDIDDILDVHGGITFSDSCHHDIAEDRGICHKPGPGEPDDVFWFGFDCSHAFDYMPGLESKHYQSFVREHEYATYRDLAYVTAEVTKLAAQLKALA